MWGNTNWCKCTLINPNLKYIQMALFHKYKPKNQRFTNTKYELRTNQRESYKSNPKVATHQESKSPNRRTKTKWQQTSLTILHCNPQISKNQIKRKPIFLTHTKLCKFVTTHYLYRIFKSTKMQVHNRICNAISLCPCAPY